MRARRPLMHNMGQLEYQQERARCWIDLGPGWDRAGCVDYRAAALDSDLVQLEELLIGGANEDWPVEEHPDSVFPGMG